MKQTTLPAAWIAENEELSAEESLSEELDEAKKKTAILYWTRVKSLDMIKDQNVHIYEANRDLKFDKSVAQVRKELRGAAGQFIFDPVDFKDQAAGFRVEEYKLPEDGLREYARIATRLRQQFQDKADAAKLALGGQEGAEEEKGGFIVPELYRGCKKDLPLIKNSEMKRVCEARDDRMTRKKRPKCQLDSAELLEIIRRVKEEGASYKEVALLFSVKPALVSELIRNEKEKNFTVAQVMEKREARQNKRSQIKACVEEQLS